MAALVSSSASHVTEWPPGTTTTSSRSPSASRCASSKVVVRQVGALAEDEERRNTDVLEARRHRRHFAVGCDHGRLAEAVADAAVVSRVDVRREILDDELAGREVELALVVAAVDKFVERHVRLVRAGVVGRRERDVAGKQDRRVEENELRNELRRACRQLEREPSSERMADQDRLAGADRPDDRVEVRADVPRGLPRRVAVAEKIRGDDVVAREAHCERREVPPVIPDAMEADNAWRAGIAPLVEREPHPEAASTSSESGTISVRRSSRSITSDQMTVPPRSMRNVPRCGAPFVSLNTPYAFAAAPCGQKSDANVYSAPSSFFHA